MSVTIESTKKLKRQVVVPFEGEEKFVVPKKGGFGQADNQHYVMVTGSTTLGGTPTAPAPSPSTSTQIGTDVGTTTSTSSPTQVGTSASTTVTGATTPSPTTTQPSGQVTTPLSNIPTSTTPPPRTTLPPIVTIGVDTAPTPSGSTPSTQTYTPSQAQLDCEANGGIWSNGTCTNPRSTSGGTINTIPTFPNWDTLNCESLKAKISELESTMATSRFAQNVVDAYNSQLAYARSLVSTKCYVAPTPTPPPAPAIGGGVFGGGGGGGFGQEPSADVPQAEEKKSNIGLFLVIGVVGGLYFLLRKK